MDLKPWWCMTSHDFFYIILITNTYLEGVPAICSWQAQSLRILLASFAVTSRTTFSRMNTGKIEKC